MSSTVNTVQQGTIQEVVDWTGKKFGELRGFRIVANDIRILSHTSGFAVFLPEAVWRKLDYQVSISFPQKENTTCWIAGKNFTFVKVDTKLEELEGSNKEYMSEDVEVALNKIERFVSINFFQNRQAYPDSESFTHGSMVDKPNMQRHFRLRFGGNFHYQF
jgi:hypothetical protein